MFIFLVLTSYIDVGYTKYILIRNIILKGCFVEVKGDQKRERRTQRFNYTIHFSLGKWIYLRKKL